jgi:two-component system invasion response regulator UvrY
MKEINLLITDDHKMIRETWSFFLNKDPRFNVIAVAGNGEEAVILVQQFHPDIVLMDVNLPGINGIEATQAIRKASPATKVLGVSMQLQPSYAFKMIQHGASGYLTKSSSIEEMCKAILDVHHNRTYICQSVKDALADLTITSNGQEALFNLVTKREIEVIELITKGYSSREIADHLNVGLKTIEIHRYHILKKLKLKNVAALVNYFFTNAAVIYR